MKLNSSWDGLINKVQINNKRYTLPLENEFL